jgi:hypothetical protein
VGVRGGARPRPQATGPGEGGGMMAGGRRYNVPTLLEAGEVKLVFWA